MPAIVRAERRVNRRLIECEAVSAGRSDTVITRTRASQRPPVAVDARAPEGSTTNTRQTHEPAAHEVKI